ncbi:MAG: hypothetical protein Q4G30_04750 [Actinomycetaceae bacterium]|nr:hypothetical protein [Actinomycetaceae bacterium]
MEWFTVIPAMVCALAWLLLPGLGAAWGLGLQGPLRWIAAMPISAGLLTLALLITAGTRLPWAWWTVSLLVGIEVLAIASGRLYSMKGPAPWPLVFRSSWSSYLTLTGVAASALSVVPLGIGMISPHTPMQVWDSVFHLSAIQEIRHTFDASPWTGLADLFHSSSKIYPTTVDALIALLPAQPVTALNAFLLAAFALWPWCVGAFVHLSLSTLKGQSTSVKVASGTAMLLSASIVTYPSTLFTVVGALPYAASVLSIPGVVALGLAFLRSYRASLETSSVAGATGRFGRILARIESSSSWPWIGIAVLLGVIGTAGLHPTGIFCLILIALPGFLQGIGLWIRAHWRKPLTLLVALGFTTGLVGVAWFLLGPRLASMAAFQRKGFDRDITAQQLLHDMPMSQVLVPASHLGVVITGAALLGVLFALKKRRFRWAAFVWFIFAVLILIAGGPQSAIRALTAPWYMQPSRLAPLFWLFSVFLCGLCIMYTHAAWISRQITIHKAVKLGVPATLIAGIVLISAGGNVQARSQLASRVYDPKQIAWGTMLTAPEEQFIRRVSPSLKDDAVIYADPFNGGPYWWSIGGIQVVLPQLSRVKNPDLEYLWDHAQNLETDKRICQILKQLGATHVYRDDDPGAVGAEDGAKRDRHRGHQPASLLPDSALSLIAREGPYSLLLITGCEGEKTRE